MIGRTRSCLPGTMHSEANWKRDIRPLTGPMAAIIAAHHRRGPWGGGVCVCVCLNVYIYKIGSHVRQKRLGGCHSSDTTACVVVRRRTAQPTLFARDTPNSRRTFFFWPLGIHPVPFPMLPAVSRSAPCHSLITLLIHRD